MSRNIEGKIVVITGASSGLGESTARHLAKLRATVVLGARRTNRLDAIVKDIQTAGGKALPVTVDVTKRAEVEGLVPSTEDHRHILSRCTGNVDFGIVRRFTALES